MNLGLESTECGQLDSLAASVYKSYDLSWVLGACVKMEGEKGTAQNCSLTSTCVHTTDPLCKHNNKNNEVESTKWKT